MGYIDVGYAVALGVLSSYAAWLWHRRRRLEPRTRTRPGAERPSR